MLHFLGNLKSVRAAIIPNTKGIPQPIKLLRAHIDPMSNCILCPAMLKLVLIASLSGMKYKIK